MSLTLAEALAHADRGIAKALEMEVKVALVVVDAFGQIVQLDRMDGASLMAPDIAEAKAVTAVNFKRPTGALSQMAGQSDDGLPMRVVSSGISDLGESATI